MPQIKPSNILRKIITTNYSSANGDNLSDLLELDEISWKILTDEAASFGLAPLLYITVRNLKIGPSPEVGENLHKMYISSATQNLLTSKDIDLIIDALDGVGVKNILLKGASLIQTIYSDPAMRPMLDIDLLVDYNQLSRSIDAVERLGYTITKPFPYQDETGLFWSQVGFTNGDSLATVLELHWHLLDIPDYSQRIPFRELWQVKDQPSKIHGPWAG
jgi:hypothetical protein